jgi:hypothetical protein
MRGEGEGSFLPSLVPWLMDRDRDQSVVVRLVCGEIPQAMAKNLMSFPNTSFQGRRTAPFERLGKNSL